MGCTLEEDAQDIISRCIEDLDLLRVHPLYLLSFIYDNRFMQWTDWFSVIWRQLVEVETATRLTPAIWRTPSWEMEPQESHVDADRLLVKLHSTQLEMCHSRAIILFALDLGRFCIQTLEEAEQHCQNLGCEPLQPKDRNRLRESFHVTLVRSGAMKNRLDELSDRLSAMINAVRSPAYEFPQSLNELTLGNSPSISSHKETARPASKSLNCKRAIAAQ
jgi:hypothetical protein